jgi:phage-related minor tail protein
MTETSSGLIDGTVIAAVVTGLVALLVLAGNQYQARKDRLRKDFAEALAAVERYAELPYRILRRQDSTPEVRGHIAEQVHEVQQDILFHKSWVRIQSSEVAEVYDALLGAMREEAGVAMTQAWNTAPITRDEDMSLGDGFSFTQMGVERVRYVEAVRWQLQPVILRWTRERLIPWLKRRTNRETSDPSRPRRS